MCLGKEREPMQHVHAAPLLGGPRTPSMCWFDVGWERRTPPHHHHPPPTTNAEGWNREAGTEEEARKGRSVDRWTLL